MGDRLIHDAWDKLRQLSTTTPATARYNYWARINLEPDPTMITINAEMFRAAMNHAIKNDLAEFLELLQIMDRKAAERERAEQAIIANLDLDERTADW